MAKGEELVKYITERVATFIDTPKEVRRQQKVTAKRKEPWEYRWFGMIPMSIWMWMKQWRKK